MPAGEVKALGGVCLPAIAHLHHPTSAPKRQSIQTQSLVTSPPRHTCKVGQLAGPRLFVETLGVALLTQRQRNVQVNLQKIAYAKGWMLMV